MAAYVIGAPAGYIDAQPLDIEITDIAHGLARVARWNGQTKGTYGYSVAQHSVLVEDMLSRNAPRLPQKWRLACLLHDAPEYVIGDMITPFKANLGKGYKDIEARLMEAVHLRFGLPAMLPEAITKSIKRADRMAAFLEATQLAGFDEAEATRLFSRPRGTPADILLDPLPLKRRPRCFCGGLNYYRGKKYRKKDKIDIKRGKDKLATGQAVR